MITAHPVSSTRSSVVARQSVRVFQVRTQQFVAVTAIVRELAPGVDYTAVSAVTWWRSSRYKPLPEYSSFMAVLTNDIK